MSTIEATTPEKKVYIWPIDDAETERLSNLLKIDFRTFNMKQHNLHSPQYVCHSCGKLTGLDDSVGTALALGNHDAEFIINFITNPEARMFHKHELQCCVDGTTYLERYSIESDEGKALFAHFQYLKASGISAGTLSDDAKSGKTAVLEYPIRWFGEKHTGTVEPSQAALVDYPIRWFGTKAAETAEQLKTALVEYPIRWFGIKAADTVEQAPTAKVEYPIRWFGEEHTDTVDDSQTAKVEYPIRWFGEESTGAVEKAQTAKVEYPIRWFGGEHTDTVDEAQTAKVEYPIRWFGEENTGAIEKAHTGTVEDAQTAKVEYPIRWFADEVAVEGDSTEKKDTTSETKADYSAQSFSAAGVVSPKEEEIKEKSANPTYYPKGFASKLLGAIELAMSGHSYNVQSSTHLF